jgi:hypothetical protein
MAPANDEPPMQGVKRYLGDGVFVCVENGMLKLTTEDGICSTNTIYLEPAVWHNLAGYVEALRQPTPEGEEEDGSDETT